MSDEPGFRIGDEHFPHPETVEFGDTMLIRKLTGLSMLEYAELDDDDTDIKMICLVGMAVRHARPAWSLDKVGKFIEQVDFEKFGVVGEEDTDADPPAVNGEDVTSPPLSPGSTGDAAGPSSDAPAPDLTGTQA